MQRTTSRHTPGRFRRALRKLAGQSLVALCVTGCGESATPDESAALEPKQDHSPFPASIALNGAPVLFAPTKESFGLSVAIATGDPSKLGARVWGENAHGDLERAEVLTFDLAEWTIDGLEAGQNYEYEVVEYDEGREIVLYQGSVTTARPPGTPFSFALISDSHIGANLEYSNQGDENVLAKVTSAIDTIRPDFMVNLGDMLDYHQYGFNAPPPNGEISRLAYLNYRTFLGDMSGRTPHFPVVGNWEGENGEFAPEVIAWSREQRMLYMPAPEPATNPEGGSPYEDYYAFTWGDALFVVLNVMTYTPTAHLLATNPGLPDDWTLGTEQLDWLRTTLENATSRWRFILIHHAVGGAAGDLANSAYGRGGGQAAYVGEQAVVHQLMLDYGVQAFFYGHDHVFTDIVVDGIHYTEPGSAGAPWMFTQAETGYTQSWREAGWGRVDVTPDSVHVQFISITGEILYEYTLP